ncbi:MAG: hypothetical protein AAFU79_03810, partial [Myxococcota bacterium]
MGATGTARSHGRHAGHFKAGELVIEARSSEDRLRLDWTGRSSAREPWGELQGYFEDITESLAERGHGLQLRFNRIEYFNSSTITALIRIIQLCQSRHIELEVLYDGNLRWQKLSFDGLKVFEQSNKLLKIREV